MNLDSAYGFKTDEGWLWFMVIESMIVAQKEDGTVGVHQATQRGPVTDWGDGFSLGDLIGFGDEMAPQVLVGRILHPTDTQIGFYIANWFDWYGWGYIWNVDHPERSRWERAEFIAGTINSDDLPQSGTLPRIAEDVPQIASVVQYINPRAAALATITAGAFPEEVVAKLSGLRQWLEKYETALRECYLRPDLSP